MQSFAEWHKSARHSMAAFIRAQTSKRLPRDILRLLWDLVRWTRDDISDRIYKHHMIADYVCCQVDGFNDMIFNITVMFGGTIYCINAQATG